MLHEDADKIVETRQFAKMLRNRQGQRNTISCLALSATVANRACLTTGNHENGFGTNCNYESIVSCESLPSRYHIYVIEWVYDIDVLEQLSRHTWLLPALAFKGKTSADKSAI